MAIDEGVTEVADSDEELMTSSPFVGADDAAKKLPAMASGQPQELQGALQSLHSNPQALGQDDAKSTPQGTAALGVGRYGASTDFDASTTDVKLEGAVAAKEEQIPPPISHLDPAIPSQMNYPGFAPETVHVPVANSSMRQLPSSPPGETQPYTIAQPLSNSSAPKDTCSNSAKKMTITCDSEAHDGRTHAGPSHVVNNGSSQSRPEDIRQNASEDSNIIHPSKNAVHTSQAMGISDTTRTLAAATNSLPSTTLSLTGPVLNPVPSKEGIEIHPDPDSNDIQGQPCIETSPTNLSKSPSKVPQKVTLAELKAQKASLLTSLRSLPAIQVLIEEMASSDAGVDGGCDGPTDADIMDAANKIVKQHIKLLHEYNELKDVGQGLMGLIADQRGVRIVEVHEEFGVDAKD